MEKTLFHGNKSLFAKRNLDSAYVMLETLTLIFVFSALLVVMSSVIFSKTQYVEKIHRNLISEKNIVLEMQEELNETM